MPASLIVPPATPARLAAQVKDTGVCTTYKEYTSSYVEWLIEVRDAAWLSEPLRGVPGAPGAGCCLRGVPGAPEAGCCEGCPGLQRLAAAWSLVLSLHLVSWSLDTELAHRGTDAEFVSRDTGTPRVPKNPQQRKQAAGSLGG
jgi:hypothetical protein